MSAETFLFFLLRVNLIAGSVILLVLALRPLVLRWLGADTAYRLWFVVPMVVAAAVLPAPEAVYVPQSLELPAFQAEEMLNTAAGEAEESSQGWSLSATAAVGSELAEALVSIWVLGALFLLVNSILSTRRLARDAALGPALIGVLHPRLVLPPDFETRFDARERELILAHEEVHRVSCHTLVNALVELLRCLNWFNPLAHVAAFYLRTDQELACDAAVICAHPSARRVYAQALLKTRIAASYLPLGCTWTSRSGKRLGQRIEMLARPSLSRRAVLAGTATVLVLGMGLGFGAWAQQEPRSTRPEPKWTVSSAIPAGEQVLSHQLEAQRHDFFIELARQGDIDLVFFGTTDTEMFWWPERGKGVFEKAFADIKAANFGSQGTSPKSLLWRMQNGELDGYAARLIVFQLWGIGDRANAESAERLEALPAILAEIKARQPQAKILLSAPFPRGFAEVEAWRELARTRAALVAPLVDNQSVFYTDIGERFYQPDGTHNNALWARAGIKGVGVGIQPAAFEVWAEELQPWLSRFVP